MTPAASLYPMLAISSGTQSVDVPSRTQQGSQPLTPPVGAIRTRYLIVRVNTTNPDFYNVAISDLQFYGAVDRDQKPVAGIISGLPGTSQVAAASAADPDCVPQ